MAREIGSFLLRVTLSEFNHVLQLNNLSSDVLG
jgi:hypothetical protein